MRFRKFKSIRLPVEAQGDIYFRGKNYSRLPESEKKEIRDICEQVGGEYAGALMAFVTQNLSFREVSDRYYVSVSTLYELRRKYYMAFAAYKFTWNRQKKIKK